MMMALVSLFIASIVAVESEPTCEPVYRPSKAKRVPLPAGIERPPNFITVLVDDLGWDDTSLRSNGNNISFTPRMEALQKQGIALMRHHTYLWCSPTRRSFLSGRFPVHITGTQAPTCSNYLPLQYTTLSEKLEVAGYNSIFIGKGHLGYQTVEHLPNSRGFSKHVGYLGGGESYKWGGKYGQPNELDKVRHFDMWQDQAPAVYDVVDTIEYSTEFYASEAVASIEAHAQRNATRPFWLHLAMQAVHGGTWREDVPSQDAKVPNNTDVRDLSYAQTTCALDRAIGNITDALVAAGMWDNTILLLTSDNGGDCGLPDQPGVKGQPGSASNYPLLGRKCTAFEGGTRVPAFVSGGLIPKARRGLTLERDMMHIADWYPTMSALAGVEAADEWVDPTTNQTYGIDGVNLWPTIVTGEENRPLREWLPTTERSLLWDDRANNAMYKLVVNESQTNRFHPNGSQYMDDRNPCLPKSVSDAVETEAYVRKRARESAIMDPGLSVPPSCAVCSEASPCLYEVLSDPLETVNIAKQKPDIVAKLRAQLSTYQPYVPATLTPAQLACYNCVNVSWVASYGDYVGPCCLKKSS